MALFVQYHDYVLILSLFKLTLADYCSMICTLSGTSCIEINENYYYYYYYYYYYSKNINRCENVKF